MTNFRQILDPPLIKKRDLWPLFLKMSRLHDRPIEYGGSDAAGFQVQGLKGSFYFLSLDLLLELSFQAVKKLKTQMGRNVACSQQPWLSSELIAAM